MKWLSRQKVSENRRRRLREAALKPMPRWAHARKELVCRAIGACVVSEAEIVAAHGLGEDELKEWLDGYRRFGVQGLMVSKRPRRAA
jgi:hypothetical protein